MRDVSGNKDREEVKVEGRKTNIKEEESVFGGEFVN